MRAVIQLKFLRAALLRLKSGRGLISSAPGLTHAFVVTGLVLIVVLPSRGIAEQPEAPSVSGSSALLPEIDVIERLIRPATRLSPVSEPPPTRPRPARSKCSPRATMLPSTRPSFAPPASPRIPSASSTSAASTTISSSALTGSCSPRASPASGRNSTADSLAASR